MVNNFKPKISVVMPFYNAAVFLDESIKSILEQSFTDFEFIIINDGSTDDSDFIIKKYLNDNRIKYIKNSKNEGISHNLNLGIEMAKADIIARMDGDDVATPFRLVEQYNFLEANKDISIVGSFAKVINEVGEQIREMKYATEPSEIKRRCFYYGPFLHPTVMYRKDAIKAVGMYKKEFFVCEDLDMFLRLLYSGYAGANIPKFLLNYRKHSLSTDKQSATKAKLGLKLKKDIIEEFKLKPSVARAFFIYAGYWLELLPRKYKMKMISLSKRILNLK
jgi:glycosyltransferase involved in cell wall biosynthesis